MTPVDRGAMELLKGVTARHAAGVLRDLAKRANSLVVDPGPINPSSLRESYLAWATDAEESLAEITDDESTGERVLSNRHWRIVDAPPSAPHTSSLIEAEVKSQTRWLGRSAQQLEDQIKHLEEPDGDIFLLDSNIFLQFRLFTDIDWTETLSCNPVRLVVPLTVLTELDDKKNSSKSSLSKRAHKVLSELNATLGASAGRPSEISDGVTIEVIDRERASSARNADDEILAEAQYLTQILDQRNIAIVSDDTSLRLRASARRLRALTIPDSLKIVDTSDGVRAKPATKLVLRSTSGLNFLDPPERSVPEFNIMAVLERAASSVEPLEVPYGPTANFAFRYSREDAVKYNSARDAWLSKMGDWAKKCAFLRTISRNGAQLLVVISNSEETPINNLQVVLNLEDADAPLRFARDSDFDLPKAPAPPKVPKPSIPSMLARAYKGTPAIPDPRDLWGWAISDDRLSATIEVAKIWQGQSLPLDDDIVVYDASEGVVGGFNIAWKILSSEPVATITGKISVRPRG
ncbi:PIN domain-containing protein [Streptomyces avermitilis]|uniref:PIN domain-containing protein n=1 Tax=Streptomyces avermitilis TaxID=33903 RepID=UPI0036AE1086